MELQGRVLKPGMTGEDVRLLQTELGKLGFNIPSDEQGHYGVTTSRMVEQFQAAHGLDAMDGVDQETAARINEEVDKLWYVVEGRISFYDGQPVAGVTVEALDKDLRDETSLGKVTTDGAGRYLIEYSVQELAQRGKSRADLIVRACDAEGNKIAESDLILNAAPKQSVDLVYDNKPLLGPAEYTKVQDGLSPLLDGVDPADLTDDDIGYLAGKTGLDLRQIVDYGQSARLARDSHIEGQDDLTADLFYGLLSQGLPGTLLSPRARDTSAVRRALEEASQNNVLTPLTDQELDSRVAQTVERSQQVTVDEALKPAPEGHYSLGDLLGTTLESEDERRSFLEKYVQHEGPVRDFWVSLSQPGSEFQDQVDDLQLTLQLAVLTGNNVPLVEKLKEKNISSIRDLARLDWMEKLVDTDTLPPDVPGKDAEEKKRNYLRVMTWMLEDAFPTAVIAYKANLAGQPGDAHLCAFFDNNPSFEFRAGSVDSYLKDDSCDWGDVPEEAQQGVRQQLKTMARLYRVTPRYERYETMSKLQEFGYDSALSIARMDQHSFAKYYSQELGSHHKAKAVHGNACQAAATSLTVLMKYSPLFNSPDVAVLPGQSELTQQFQEWEESQGSSADWETLFPGYFALCDCQHCRSVLSPAAYLVDLLDFLRRSGKQETAEDGTITFKDSALEALLERRSSIVDLELSCENTNTPVPYVDLVNEVLENSVIRPSLQPYAVVLPILILGERDEIIADALAQVGFPLSSDWTLSVEEPERKWWVTDGTQRYAILHNEQAGRLYVRPIYQTRGTQEELSAHPEYLHKQAYDELAKSIYPWNLPFDLWAEEARTYLEHLGVARHRLAETFYVGDDLLEDVQLAGEYLGLTPLESAIITGASLGEFLDPVPSDNDFWSLGQDWVKKLKESVPLFLERSGLSFEELLELLDTNFVDPDREISVEPPTECDLSKMDISNLTSEALGRIHRFLRLWRKLDWGMYELDKVITALNLSNDQADIDETFLLKLSHLQRLRAELKVPLISMLSWWSPIDTDNRGGQVRSLYEQLFLNKAVLNPVDSAFAVGHQGGEISDHAPTILAALEINDSDLARLVSYDFVFSIPCTPEVESSLLEGSIPVPLRDAFKTNRVPLSEEASPSLEIEVGEIIDLDKTYIFRKEEQAGPIERWVANVYYLDPDSESPNAWKLLFFVPWTDELENALVTAHTRVPKVFGDKFADEGKPLSDDASLSILIKGKIPSNGADYLFKEEEGELIVSGQLIGEVSDELSLKNLSHLYRIVTFSRALKLSIAEYLAVKMLTGLDPFDPPEPKTTLKFVDKVQDIRKSGFAISELNYLLRHVCQEADGIAPTEAEVALILSEIRDGLQEIIAETAEAPDPTGELTGTALAHLRWDDAHISQVISTLSGRAIYQAPLPILPSDIDADHFPPDELRGRVSYVSYDPEDDPPKENILRFVGPMTKAQKSMLLGLSASGDFHSAVNKLFDAPRTFIAEKMKVFELPTFSASLDHLPTAIDPTDFPPQELTDKVYFDAAARELRCVGLMTEAERTALLNLVKPSDPDSPAFQDAVNALFNAPTVYRPEPENQFLTAEDDPSQLFDMPRTAEERFDHVLAKLMPYLRDSWSQRLITQKLAETLELEARVMESLLARWVLSPVHSSEKSIDEFLAPSFARSNTNVNLTADTFPDQFKTFGLLHKIAKVILAFRVELEELPLLFSAAHDGWAEARLLDLNDLPSSGDADETPASFRSWGSLAGLLQFKDALLPGEPNLFEMLNTVFDPKPDDSPATENDLLGALSQRTGWSLADLQFLTGPEGMDLTFPDDYRDVTLLFKLKERFALIKRLGVSAAETWCWKDLGVASDQAYDNARGIKGAAKAKYDYDRWLKVARPLRDVLREKQRTALVSYLVADDENLEDANQLYEHYLLDVEMSACMLTSRIKLAISSVQLFIQRCLMNLEAWRIPSPRQHQLWNSQWEWMQNYRVWEANRKIFLYPENWIEPELRDDKSPFFKELENELLQNEVTEETAERALLNYLENLDQVARLEICGMYHEVETEDGTPQGKTLVDILHVFGRTRGTPHIYYYRRLVDGSNWSPWERVDVDIEGDHLIPVVYNRRLYLFWPVFAEKADEVSSGESLPKEQAPEKHWEIQLGWSEYRNGRWCAKTVSNEALDLTSFKDAWIKHWGNKPAATDEQVLSWLKHRFIFDLRLENGDLTIICNTPELGNVYLAMAIGSFRFTGCNDVSTVQYHYYLDDNEEPRCDLSIRFSPPYDSHIEFMTFVQDPGTHGLRLSAGKFDDSGIWNVGDSIAVLDRTPSVFSILCPHQGPRFVYQLPHFFQDNTRTFFVIPQGEDTPSEGTEADAPDVVPPEEANSEWWTPPEVWFDQLWWVHQWYWEKVQVYEQWEEVTTPIEVDPFIYEESYAVEPYGNVATGRSGRSGYRSLGATGTVQNGLGELSRGPGLHLLDESAPQARATYALSPATATKRYEFKIFYHPYAREFIRHLNRDGIDGLLQRCVQIMPPALFSMGLEFRIDLNRRVLSDDLRRLFTKHRIALSDQVRVQLEKSEATVWLIVDDETTYILRKEQDPEDPQGGYWARVYPDDAEEGAHLFAVGWTKDFDIYLDAGNIPPLLEEGFEDAELPLSDRASPWPEGRVWLITDQVSEQSYTVKREGGQLNVYELFERIYQPVYDVVERPYPWEDVDFQPTGAYSQYNWELFFHAPLLIAQRLSQNQRFEEALKWFHYIFDPTDISDHPEPQRFWQMKWFFEAATDKPIQDLLELLNQDDQDMKGQVEQWEADPFKPHLIARLRTAAYQKTVVMKYIDNLIAWGDQLFRRDTIESINQATLLYIIAAEILGRRPEDIPRRAEVPIQTFNQLQANLDDFANALVGLEDQVRPATEAGRTFGAETQWALALGPSFYLQCANGDCSGSDGHDTLYFCVPKNEELLSYWDTVADRLFKIRHCMTIEGVVRQLPLFEPPIEPGLLVRAAAAGVDISSVLSDLNAPLPHYRFQVILQKAVELCNDVKSLGGALLSALEKRDAEELALLRSGHEIQLLKAVKQIKKKQVDEATETLDSLEQAKALATIRSSYYQGLLGLESKPTPGTVPQIVQPNLIPQEQEQLDKLTSTKLEQTLAMALELAAQIYSLYPDITLGTSGSTGSPVATAQIGGSLFAGGAKAFAAYHSMQSGKDSSAAGLAGIMAGHYRAAEGWALQLALAVQEEAQIDKQIEAAKIRLAIAEHELENHDLQTENAKAVDETMRNKFTNQQLYSWMVSQISSLYFQSYQMAYDLAKRAEKAFQHELGLTQASFIEFGYWDSLKKGLLAGERLGYDLKRLNVAYLEGNKREYELTKHISLAMLDPVALLMLKETGECFVNLPEAIFDLDYPGHYMRRLKSVGLTIPCVTGPYTSVNCTLTLLSNRVRKETSTSDGYPYTDLEDSRFQHNLGAIQSIATSSGQNDSGLFELNFRDERYLPFEGAGAISQWRLELSGKWRTQSGEALEFTQFDFDTISDVIFHLRYTARDGGSTLKDAATGALNEALNTMTLGDDRSGLIQLFSARRDFSNRWHRFFHLVEYEDKEEEEETKEKKYRHELELDLSPERFPYPFQDKVEKITKVFLFVKLKEVPNADSPSLKVALTPPGAESEEMEITSHLFGPLLLSAEKDLEKDPGTWTVEVQEEDVKAVPEFLREKVEVDGGTLFRLRQEAIEDLGLVCHYTLNKEGR